MGESRLWGYWTANKLQILTDYLSAFNVASSKKARDRLYVDLFAGQPENELKHVGRPIDGSVRIAMDANPGFTHLRFIEADPDRAIDLRKDLENRYPGDSRWVVTEGDCNQVVDEVLLGLTPWAAAPTFAFVDQQTSEVTWETIQKLARFRTGPRKAEIWILMSPAMIIRNLHHLGPQKRASALYGDERWRQILQARVDDVLDAEEFRDEMVNLFRWQLEKQLGYRFTARIPMRLTTGTTLYDMVFASDHDAGIKIMTDVYKKAAERQPEMMREILAAQKNAEALNGVEALFEIDSSLVVPRSFPAWKPAPAWDPQQTGWWV